ncbi:VOC family protein [Nigerium massiliense]|uniref:VOC family protein n=1 Tax=Nigerium massiliense TaxID=1522317 RepID=UPI0006942402|nr:VOC family protein [Nigerium massiliense]
MACRLTELVLNCRDPEALAAFWCAVLGYEVLGYEGPDIEIGPATGFGGAAPTIILAKVDAEEARPLRLHWDVNPVGCDQATELARLLDLGARPADVGQGETEWHVLADPEGNEFCLLATELPALERPATRTTDPA